VIALSGCASGNLIIVAWIIAANFCSAESGVDFPAARRLSG
jgi:hypothetical protein